MKVINTDKIEKYKEQLKQFVMEASEYEPLEKCRKFLFGSCAVFVLSFFALIVSLFKYREYADMLFTVMIICFLCLVFSTIAGMRMINDLEEGNVRSLIITVIKAAKINLMGKIEAVTDNEENLEFIVESDIKLKKDRKYKIYFYDRADGNLVITYAKQVSGNVMKAQESE